MAGKSVWLEYDLLRLVFNGASVSSLATSAGTTSLWVGLHTAMDDEASTASEGGYSGYTRVAVDRSTAGWLVTSGTSDTAAYASPVGAVTFPENPSTSTGTFSYSSLWLSSDAGPSGCLYVGDMVPPINFSQRVTPRVTTGSSVQDR
jgi:hypothetical protein